MACILSSLLFLDHGLMLIQCPRIDVFFISCGAIACDICSPKHSCRHVFSSAVVTLGLAGCRHTSSGIFSKTDRTSWLGTETTPTFFLPSLWKRMVTLSSKRPQAAILWKCLGNCSNTSDLRTHPLKTSATRLDFASCPAWQITRQHCRAIKSRQNALFRTPKYIFYDMILCSSDPWLSSASVWNWLRWPVSLRNTFL